MDEYEKEKSNLLSDFNEAKLQIFRLNNAWERYSTAIRSGNFVGPKGANWELDDIYGELIRDAEIEDEHNKTEEQFMSKMDKVNNLIPKYKHNQLVLYKIMRMKERILRRLQDMSGKGSKRSSEDEDDIDS